MPIRHHEVSRLEAFSDAVFAFAITLLVVSLEAPKNIHELTDMMRKSGPFAFTFVMVIWIWWQHNQFFRRYGLQDAWTATLNAVLLFVVLVYVYPLRFLTTILTGRIFGVETDATGMTVVGVSVLMLCYSAGILLIFTTFILLHVHAWRQRQTLGLTDVELLNLRFHIRSHAVSASLAAGSIALISIGMLTRAYALVPFGGWIYFLMGPGHAWNGTRQSKALARLTSTGKASEPAQT